MARPTIWQEDVATHHQSIRKMKEIVAIGQPAIKEALPKKCCNCKTLLFEKY